MYILYIPRQVKQSWLKKKKIIYKTQVTEQETQPSCTIFFSLGALLKLSQNQFK